MLGGGGSVFSVRNLMGTQMRGAVSGATQVGGEVVAAIVADKVLPVKTERTSIVAAVTRIGIGTAVGLLVQKFAGRQAGQDVINGVYSGEIRRQVKQLGFKTVTGALGAADGGGPRYINRGGQWQLNSWPGTGDQRLNGYIGTGDQRPLDPIYGV